MKAKVRQRQPQGYFYNPFEHGVSQSILGTWLDCREKARIQVILGLRPRHFNSAFCFGDMSHRCQAFINKSTGKGTSQVTIMKSVKKWTERAHDNWWTNNQHLCGNAAAEETSLTFKLLLQKMLPIYVDLYWKEDRKLKWIKPEMEFKVELDCGFDRLVPLVGAIDGVFRKKRFLSFMETKNKGQYSRESLELLTIDLQLQFYLTAMILQWPKETIGSCTYNLVKRPKIYIRKGETAQGFIERMGEKIASQPLEFFERRHIDYTVEDRDQALERIRELVRQFVAWWAGLNKDQKCIDLNPHHCEYGFRLCDFWRSCVNDDRAELMQLERPHPELKLGGK